MDHLEKNYFENILESIEKNGKPIRTFKRDEYTDVNDKSFKRKKRKKVKIYNEIEFSPYPNYDLILQDFIGKINNLTYHGFSNRVKQTPSENFEIQDYYTEQEKKQIRKFQKDINFDLNFYKTFKFKKDPYEVTVLKHNSTNSVKICFKDNFKSPFSNMNEEVLNLLIENLKKFSRNAQVTCIKYKMKEFSATLPSLCSDYLITIYNPVLDDKELILKNQISALKKIQNELVQKVENMSC